MGEVVTIRAKFYDAKLFRAPTELGEFQAAGTLEGEIDFVVPRVPGRKGGTWGLTIAEAKAVIAMLQRAVSDVTANCIPGADPRLVD